MAHHQFDYICAHAVCPAFAGVYVDFGRVDDFVADCERAPSLGAE